MPFTLTDISIAKRKRQLLKKIDRLITPGRKTIYLSSELYKLLSENRGDLSKNQGLPDFITYKGIKLLPQGDKEVND